MVFTEGEFIASRCIGYCEQCLYMVYTNDLDKSFDCSLHLNRNMNKDSLEEDAGTLLLVDLEVKDG